jgi:hypothetical protein
MKTSWLTRIVLLGVALGLGVAGYSLFARVADRQTVSPEDVAPLTVPQEQLTVGKIRGGLQVLVNVFPQMPELESRSRAEAKAILTRTAIEIARKQLAQPEYLDVRQATVSVVAITNTNEYGDADLRTLRKYAVVKFRRDANDAEPQIVSSRVAFDPSEEAAVYRRAQATMHVKGGNTIQRKEFVEKPPEPLDKTATELPSPAAEQIIFDEVDLYDHPVYAGDRYPAFAPERVRRNNSDYYLVTDASRAAPQSAGPRFGELVLRAEAGSVVYLPRAISYRGAAALSFSYRKSNPKARCMVSVHLAPDRRATLLEGDHPAFARRADTDWHHVSIPLSALIARSVRPSAATGAAAPASHHLEYHEVAPGEIFALELGLWEASAGATLHFDRIALLHKAPAERVLRGNVDPPLANLQIEINSPTAKHTAVTDAKGHFEARLPADAKRYEVFTRHNGITFQPQQARYFDAGGYLTPVRINLRNEPPQEFKARKKSVQYFWDKDGCGVRYRPREHLLHCVFETMPQEYFTENATNALGFFDRDRRPENPSKAYRILLTGECYTEGSQIDSQEKLAAQMEAILRFRHDRPIEVPAIINPIMSFTAAWPSLEKFAFPLKPDLILIPVVAVDQIMSLYREYDAWRWGYHPDYPRQTFFERDKKTGTVRPLSVDPSWNLHVSEPWVKKPNEHYQTFGGVDWSKDLYRVDSSKRPEFLNETVDLLADILKHFNEAATKHGTKIALVDFTFIESKQWTENGVDYDTRRFHAFLGEAATKAGIELLDGTKVLTAQSIPRPNGKGGFIHSWEHNGHWSPAGHRFAAEGIAAELEARGLLGTPAK